MENQKPFETRNNKKQEVSVGLSETERNSLSLIYKAINIFSKSEEKNYFGNRVDLSQSQLVNELRESGIEPSTEMKIDALNSIIKPLSEAEQYQNEIKLSDIENIINKYDPDGSIYKKVASTIPEMGFVPDWNGFLFSILDCANEGDFGYWENAKEELRKIILE